MPQLRSIQLPKLRAEVRLAPDTLDEEARTVEVIFYSGAAVQRFPYFDDPYELSFDLTTEAVRLDRFNSGAPVVDNHRDYGSVSEVVLGVVEKAWLADDGGHAVVRFSARDEVLPILQDVRDGILRNFSMGAVIHQLRDITEKGDTQKRLLAIDWEPHELSIVPVPADPGAQALASAERFPCQFLGAEAAPIKEVQHMDKITVRLLIDVEELGSKGDIVEIEESDFDAKLHSKDLKKATETQDPGDQVARDRLATDRALEANRARAKEIKRIQVEFGLDDIWTQYHVKNNSAIEQVLTDATEKRAQNKPVIDPTVSFGEDFESIGWRTDRMVEALSARSRRVEVPEAAQQYARLSFADAALECLALNGRTRGRALDARRNPQEVIELALHTTSDFPLLLANTLNKNMLPAYENAMPTYRRVAIEKSFRDFRAHNFLKAGDFPNLLQVGESGEFQSGSMSEGNEAVTCVTYGRILGISRQILVNDDLGAFNDLATAAARRVSDFENATFYSVCILAAAGLGPTLVEGSAAVYNSGAHANVTGAGALSNALLESAYALMLAQTSLDGIKLNVMPGILLVPPGSYGLARRLTRETNPTQASEVNTFAGMLEPVTDANLSGTRFYALSNPGPYSNYVYGSLEGQSGPYTEVQNGFRVDGVEVKVRRDFGCGAIDFRFGVTGAGA